MFMKPLDLEISLEIRYQQAIKVLLDRGLDHSDDEARTAASVLLSAERAKIYPYQEWLVSIADLIYLDPFEQSAVMGVIHGRIELNRPPSVMIQGGAKLMHRLWHRWRNVENW